MTGERNPQWRTLREIPSANGIHNARSPIKIISTSRVTYIHIASIDTGSQIAASIVRVDLALGVPQLKASYLKQCQWLSDS